MIAVAGEDQKGLRLDVAAVNAMPNLSRAFIQKLCSEGKVRINGTVEKPGYKLRVGDKLEIDYDADKEQQVPDIELPVAYEDNDCVVVDKPAGVLTHAQGKLSHEATVATFLRSRLSKKLAGSEWGTGERVGIVHRLDRATSGLIICAKSQDALSKLQKQFANRSAKKTYIAVVMGHLREPEALIDMPIERNPKAPATFRVGSNGKEARTYYKVLSESDKYSLLELKPETGRTHQLRVHLMQLGHPIVGDYLYGDAKFGDRLFLHAAGLSIKLPNGQSTTFESPVPSEFDDLMNK